MEMNNMIYSKLDIERFDYNSKYNLPDEHKWDFLKDEEKATEFTIKKADKRMPIKMRTQSNPEITGQKGTML